MAQYDYLIVGSGLFGAVFAHKANMAGRKCLVIDKRSHAGGNIYCRNEQGINVHEYGAHIFHTNDKRIWDFVNQFANFNNYINTPLANYKGRIFNLPFNMNTFRQLWGISSVEEAREKIESETRSYQSIEPKNLEEQALKLVGPDIYNLLVKEYTEKHWGRQCTELPAFIIKRLPLRFTYNNNYFDDRYQGIPIGGYNSIIDGLLNGIEVKLNSNFFDDRNNFENIAKKIIYTGALDEFYHYQFGELQYRSLKFEHTLHEVENFQGNAVVNYTSHAVPFTRTIEHKHFEFGTQPFTIVSTEYALEWKKGAEPFYPINDAENTNRFKKYIQFADAETQFIFGGRLAEYRYYDMHQVIASALQAADKELSE